MMGSMCLHGLFTAVLDQKHFIGQLENIWGASSIATAPHHNDCVCLFWINMTNPEYRETY